MRQVIITEGTSVLSSPMWPKGQHGGLINAHFTLSWGDSAGHVLWIKPPLSLSLSLFLIFPCLPAFSLLGFSLLPLSRFFLSPHSLFLYIWFTSEESAVRLASQGHISPLSQNRFCLCVLGEGLVLLSSFLSWSLIWYRHSDRIGNMASPKWTDILREEGHLQLDVIGHGRGWVDRGASCVLFGWL